MDPMLIVFGIRTLLRLSREGSAAFAQYQRDKPALFPDALVADFRAVDFIRDTFFPDHIDLLAGDGPLAPYWRDLAPAADVPNATEVLYLAAVQLRAEAAARLAHRSPQRALEVGGAMLIQQWQEGTGPVGPIGRVVLTMADIALEFVGTHPSVLGLGGRGEKLLGALASNLATMIPDDGDAFGPKSQFADRVVGIVLRAGLQTLQEQPQLVASQAHLQALIAQILPPVIAAFPETLADQSRWQDVTDALLGPATRVALGMMADHPHTFFGSAFHTGTAVGAVTQALLREASKAGVEALFSTTGFLTLYKAALGVAAERPEVFLGRPDTPGERIATTLFAKIATTLRSAPVPFNADLGAALVGIALDAMREYGMASLGGNGPWEQALVAMVSQVLDGLQAALAPPEAHAIKSLLSPQQWLEFARIFLTQAAQTPGMLVGDHLELQAMVQGVAQAMVQDRRMVLTPQDWLRLAAVVAEEAATNPLRLFTLAPGSIGSALIQDLLAVAAEESVSGGRRTGGVLFGSTLCETVLIVLRAAVGQVKAATEQQAALKDLAQQLSVLVREQPALYGRREWLGLYRVLVGRVLQSGPLGRLTELEIQAMLAEGARA